MKKIIRLGAPLLCFILSTISIIAAPSLVPFTPSGWTYPVVVTTAPNATGNSAVESSPLFTTNTLYIDFAWINNGSTASSPFYVYVYVDTNLDGTLLIDAQGPGTYELSVNDSIGMLSAGAHTVAMVVDATDVYSSTLSAYTNTITVSLVTLPAPTLSTPINGVTGQYEVPFFAWSPVTEAVSYRVLIATNASDLPGSPTATNGGASVVIDAVAPANNFSPTITLNPNAKYYWEVHAIESGGESGTWSGVQSFVTGPAGSGITIIPTFGSSITGDPNAATIEATINAAISVYRQKFSDPITANFTFAEMTQGLGENDGTYYETVAYSSYLSALTNHAATADDATALAHLPPGPANPVNGNADIDINYALARALGFGAPPGNPDSTVYLNTSIMNLSSLQTDPNNFSLFATVSHEMDEALGLGSALNGSTNGVPAPTGPVEPEDLFRYDQSGNRSFNTQLSTTSFFSLDGTTDLAQFNQYAEGDFGDRYSYNVSVIPQVQDAFLINGVNPVLDVELRVLDVIGFTRIIPQPQLTGVTVSGGNCQFTLVGTDGYNCIVESSGNLVTWAPLSTI